MNNKICSIDLLKEKIKKEKACGKIIVHCHGVFDLLHIGHIRYLESSKKLGDVLVVTLTQDKYVNKGPNRPAFPDNLRAEAIAALDCVDYVAINKWPTAVDTINLLKPDIYAKGQDYKDTSGDVTGNIAKEIEAVRSAGGDIHFTSDIMFSSSKLINQQMQLFSDNVTEYLNNIRQKYSVNDVIGQLDSLRDMNVMVVGEVIIDEYVYCDPLGKSGKEPILAFKYLDKELFGGGAVAIANQLTEFCEKVTLLSYLGAENTQEEFIRSRLKANVDPVFIHKSNSPTITKRRYVDKYSLSKLLSVYEINDELLTSEEEDAVNKILEEKLSSVDLVIVADYDHGFLTPKSIKKLTTDSSCLAVNTQVNAANLGFHTISKYASADYVCIHEGELRIDRRNRNDDVEELLYELSKQLKCQTVMVTRGSKGNLLFREGEGVINSPAFAVKIVDRVGAGDAVFALTSLMAAREAPVDLIGFIGNLIGAEAVTIIGNKNVVSYSQLNKSINSLLK